MSLRFALTIASLLTALPALAQPLGDGTTEFRLPPTPTVALRGAPLSLESSVSIQSSQIPGRGQRNAGIVLTSIGAGVALAGSSLLMGGLLASQDCDPRHGCGMGPALAIGIGGLTTLTSLPFLASGIPLWVSGQRKMNRSATMGRMGLGISPTGTYTLSLNGQF